MSSPRPGHRLALVGCGAIGSLVAELLEKKAAGAKDLRFALPNALAFS